MPCKYCGETIEPEEPDIRYRPGDGEHRLDFHVRCWSRFSSRASMLALKEGWDYMEDYHWRYWRLDKEEYPKERA